MIISIIGTGNVANILARLALKNGHTICQIIARNEANGRVLAQLVNADFINLHDEPNKNIDLCIVAITDEYVESVAKGLGFGSVLVIHTSGSLSMNVLKYVSTNFGVLYPLQSLRKEMEKIPVIPFLIEANNVDTYNKIETFANTMSEHVTYMKEDKRLRIHAGAVIVSNFTNYLYGLTETFCKIEEVDFNLLKPLIKETAIRLENVSALDVQTGPAIRKDVTTLGKHLSLLSAHKSLNIWYSRFSDAIMNGEPNNL